MFDYVEGQFYKCHKVSLKHGGLDSPKWLKNKKAAIYQNINEDLYFKHAVTAALNHESIGKHSESIANIRPYKS